LRDCTRFVPALNVIAGKDARKSGFQDIILLKILILVLSTLHDIVLVGATLMAAGASSPELFSSLVALFVTHSALGIGTVCEREFMASQYVDLRSMLIHSTH
jgi:Ca2+/Na+ antiporter